MLTINISWRTVLMLTIGVLLAIPVGAWASHQYSDVPNTNFHHDNISWLAQTGITQGCGDGTTYCPKDPVTREQMATFIRRLSTSRQVDAGALRGWQAEDINRASYNHTANATDGNIGVISTEIVAPKPGILIVGGSVQHVNTGSVADSATCELKAFSPTQSGPTQIGEKSLLTIPGTGTLPNGGTGSCVATGANVVTAGTWTVLLQVGEAAPNTINLGADIWTQFVPFDGNGVPVQD